MNTKSLFLTLFALSASLINANHINIKNDTNYNLDITVNGITATSFILKPGEIGTPRSFARMPIDHKDFNRIQIHNAGGLGKLGPVTELKKHELENIKNEINQYPTFLEMGRIPCIVIKAGYTGWYIQLGWGNAVK